MAKARLNPMAWAASISLVAFYVGDRWGMRADAHRDVLDGLSREFSADLLWDILVDPLKISFDGAPLLCGFAFFVAVWYAYLYMSGTSREVRDGDEYGSARLGDTSDTSGYADRRDRSNNIILSKNVRMAIVPDKRVRKTLPSANVIVYGSSGTGKTTGYVMPNILQMADRDMVVVDPKGQTLASLGHALVEAGYAVSVLDTVDMASSDRYNPLAGIRDYEDAIDFAKTLVRVVNENRTGSEPIWEQGAVLFLRAIVTLMLDWFDREDMDFDHLVGLISLARVPEGDEGGKSPLDLIFDQIRTGECWVADDEPADADPFAPKLADDRRRGGLVRVPSLMERRDGMRPAQQVRPGGRHGTDDDEALQVWREFKSSPQRTLRSFLITVFASMGHLTTPGVRRLMSNVGETDELRLDLLGMREDECGEPLPPRVVFVVSSDTSRSLRPIVSLAMWQAVRLPVRAAMRLPARRLPRHVSIVLDEFANVGELEGFVQAVSVVRSRNMNVEIILQSDSQLEDVYGERSARTIRANCATKVLLGGVRDMGTARMFSEELGKMTVYKRESSSQRSASGPSSSESMTSLSRDVLDPAEVASLDGDRALVLMGQESAVIDEKARVWDHERYDATYMAYDPERCFDYRAWADAGRPLGAALRAWEDVWFGRAVPARDDLDRAEQDSALAARRLARARAAGDDALARECAARLGDAEDAERLARAALDEAVSDAARAAREAGAQDASGDAGGGDGNAPRGAVCRALARLREAMRARGRG